MRNKNPVSLPFVVFLTGACILVIEIVATRILSPYFGNTIFTISSVISVVLAALSVGYYFGGKLADKYPTERFFYTIILVSGLSVVILHLLNLLVLPFLGFSMSIIAGPIVSSMLLFFLPGFLLGMLSPFAIKLQGLRFPEKGIGNISGEIFFWSTLGSIFGSLFAGFVLIPQFGINQIITTVAAVLAVLGVAPLLLLGVRDKSIFKIATLVILGSILASFVSTFRSDKVIYSQDGVYEKITIYNGEEAGRPTRYFQQDRSGSGAMFIDSDQLVYDYTKYYALYRIFKPELKDALVIGGGAYSIPKALLSDLPNVVVDVSEIEPSLFELAQKHFRVIKSERLHNHTVDGRRLLHDTKKKYDLIFSDVYYSLFSIPSHFTTQEFFKIAKDKLSNDGIFIANLLGDLSRQEPSLIMSEIKTFQTGFPNSYFFAVESPHKIGPQNIIAVGYNSEKTISFDKLDLSSNENTILQSLESKRIHLDRFELAPYPILTDNFSPVESLTARVLKKSFEKQDTVDGAEMMALIGQQLRYGPRYLSARGHENVQKFLIAELSTLLPETKTQTWQHLSPDGQERKLTNIIGRFNPANQRRIILATHYDSKKQADRDRRDQSQPVPGANDSASGVAVLLELARVVVNSPKAPKVGIDIVLFDAEEGEENQGADYSTWKPIGSTYFAQHLQETYPTQKPILGVVLDMVCDRDLNIYKEPSSVNKASEQVEALWKIGQKIDSNAFLNDLGQEIHDDHTSLNLAGIPSLLVIDFQYPFFHTAADTLDKCSAESLETVAKTLLEYIYSLDF